MAVWCHRCSHCRQLAPIYAALAKILATAKPEVTVAKIDGTTESEALKKYKVTGFPTIFLFHRGKVWSYEGLPLPLPTLSSD